MSLVNWVLGLVLLFVSPAGYGAFSFTAHYEHDLVDFRGISGSESLTYSVPLNELRQQIPRLAPNTGITIHSGQVDSVITFRAGEAINFSPDAKSLEFCQFEQGILWKINSYLGLMR